MNTQNNSELIRVIRSIPSAAEISPRRAASYSAASAWERTSVGATSLCSGATLISPAGTFQAWKVEIASAEGEPGQTTIWVAKDSRKVVKLSATLPQMGGAVFTSELQP